MTTFITVTGTAGGVLMRLWVGSSLGSTNGRYDVQVRVQLQNPKSCF
jgi:hypothetical protein